MPVSEVFASIRVLWSKTRIASRFGLPGRRRNDLAALSSVRRRVQAEERVYSSLMMAKKSSTATLVSWEVNGLGAFRLVGFGDGAVSASVAGNEEVLVRNGNEWVVGAVLVGVRRVLLSSLDNEFLGEVLATL